MLGKGEGSNVGGSLLWAPPRQGEPPSLPPSYRLCLRSVISSRIMLTADCAGSRAGVSVHGHPPVESGLNHNPVPSTKGQSTAGDAAVVVVGAQTVSTVGMDGGWWHLACGSGLMLHGTERQQRSGGENNKVSSVSLERETVNELPDSLGRGFAGGLWVLPCQ